MSGFIPENLGGTKAIFALLAYSFGGRIMKWRRDKHDGIKDFGGKKSCSILRPVLAKPALRAVPVIKLRAEVTRSPLA